MKYQNGNNKKSSFKEISAENQKEGNHLKSMATGGVVGAAKNAAKYLIDFGGRRTNKLIVRDKTVISSLGNAKFFAIIDMPHGNVPYHHINVNKAITGVTDPYIKISPATAEAARAAGYVLDIINKVSPFLTVSAIAYDAYGIRCNVLEDLKNGTSRNTAKKVGTIVAQWTGGYGGAGVGASIGTAIFPGVGTLIGGIVGGVAGGYGGGIGGEKLLETVFDVYELDIIDAECEKCGQKFIWRRYETGNKKCDKCTFRSKL